MSLYENVTGPDTEFSASKYLRQETAALHEAVEGEVDWDAIFSSRETYATALASLRGVVAAADDAIEQQIGDSLQDLSGRRTAAWIAQDLESLHAEVVPAEQQPNLAWVSTPAAAAGVLYVLEGSSLGGLQLAKLAESRLGLRPDRGASYFHGYGAEAGQRWRRTKAWLDHFLDTPAMANEALAAARQMFRVYGNALRIDSN